MSTVFDIDIVRRRPGSLKKLGEATPAIGNLIANAISADYAKYVRLHYLSGQVLGVRTGETRESTKFFKEDTGVFGVRPGVGIRGRLNYLMKYERGSRPFMKPSKERYQASGAPGDIAKRIYDAMERRILR
jgi:hypothetical protein